MAKSVASVACVSMLSLVNGAPFLSRTFRSSEANVPVSAGTNGSLPFPLTVTPFSYPYPVDGNTMGLECNTATSEAPQAMDDFEIGGSSFQSCLYETLINHPDPIPEALCACMGVTTSMYDVCPNLRQGMSSYLCSQDVPFCERMKDSVGEEPEAIPFDSEDAALELPFETPELPLDPEIKTFVSEKETTTASLLWMANVRNYQLAQNFKCAEGRQNSYVEREVLPGWKTERLFTPEYVAASDEGLPWVSVSSRGRDLLIVVRGTQTFPEWVSDLDLEQVPSPLGMPGKLARGFSTVAGNVLGDLQKMITEERERVIVTGHSLGGFAGTIVAGGLQRYIESSGLSAKLFGVLFASGRVGNAEWQEAMNSNTNVRFVRFKVDPAPFAVCQDNPNCGLPGTFDFSQVITGTSQNQQKENKEKNLPLLSQEKEVKPGDEESEKKSTTELLPFADRTGVLTFDDYWLSTWGVAGFGGLVYGAIVKKDMRYVLAAHSCSYQCFAASSQPGTDEKASLCWKKDCLKSLEVPNSDGNKRSPTDAPKSFALHLLAEAVQNFF